MVSAKPLVTDTWAGGRSHACVPNKRFLKSLHLYAGYKRHH
jgi:hypothetical protein